MRPLAALLLLSVPAFSQYSEIVTTDDGQQVYFATQLIERSAPSTVPVESRIYRLDGKALQLFVDRSSLAPTDRSSSSRDGASSVQVTGDGQSVAFVLTAFVLSNACPSPVVLCGSTLRRAEIRGRGATVLGEAGRVLLSRNGQWALLVQAAPGLVPISSRPQSLDSTLINVETGETVGVGRPATTNGAFALGSDGSILLQPAVGGLPGVWKAGELKPLPLSSGAFSLLGMSDDASTVLVARIALAPGGNPVTTLPVPDLIALDMRTRTSRVVQSGRPLRYLLLGMSNDGSRALFRTLDQNGPGPAMLVNIETGSSVALPINEEEQVVAGTVSGSGNAVMVGTNHGRILRFALAATGEISSTEELLPATPYLNTDTGSIVVAPGAVMEWDRPLPGDIDWSDRIRLNSLPVAVIRKSARALLVQIPWEQRVGWAPVSIEYPTASPLEQRTRLLVTTAVPRFVTPPPDAIGILGGRLVNEDFTGYVTTAPKPGQIVHMYMTGLGAVRGFVKTGEPAPLDETRPLDGFVNCSFTPHATEAETLFAGLAPGMVGIYQVTLRFPADTPDIAPTGLRCRINSPDVNLVLQSAGAF